MDCISTARERYLFGTVSISFPMDATANSLALWDSDGVDKFCLGPTPMEFALVTDHFQRFITISKVQQGSNYKAFRYLEAGLKHTSISIDAGGNGIGIADVRDNFRVIGTLSYSWKLPETPVAFSRNNSGGVEILVLWFKDFSKVTPVFTPKP